MRRHEPTTRHGRTTPGNVAHAGYTTATTRTPQHTRSDTHAFSTLIPVAGNLGFSPLSYAVTSQASRDQITTTFPPVHRRPCLSMHTAIPYMMAQDRSSDATHTRPLAQARAPTHELTMLHPHTAHASLCAGGFRR